MTRAEQYLAILRNQGSGALQGTDPVDTCLQEMLVHAAFADGVVNDDEFELLERLLPDLAAGEVLIWVANTAQKPLDMARLLDEDPAVGQAFVDHYLQVSGLRSATSFKDG